MTQSPTFGWYPATERAALHLTTLLFASDLKCPPLDSRMRVGDPSATSLVSIVVRQTARHTGCYAKHHLIRTEFRAVMVPSVRDATLDDQLIVLRLCLCLFSGQLVQVLDGGIAPPGRSVFTKCLRVLYLLTRTHLLELVLEHTLEFRPLIGDNDFHRRV